MLKGRNDKMKHIENFISEVESKLPDLSTKPDLIKMDIFSSIVQASQQQQQMQMQIVESQIDDYPIQISIKYYASKKNEEE